MADQCYTKTSRSEFNRRLLNCYSMYEQIHLRPYVWLTL
jgi:hypothetical protein